MIVLRYTKPGLERPFKVPSIGRFPLTALGVICSLALSSQYDWAVYLTFLGAMLAGAVPYAFLRGRGANV